MCWHGRATDSMECRQVGQWTLLLRARLLLCVLGSDSCSPLSALFSISVLSGLFIFSPVSPLPSDVLNVSIFNSFVLRYLSTSFYCSLSHSFIFHFSHSSSYSFIHIALPLLHSLLPTSTPLHQLLPPGTLSYFNSFSLPPPATPSHSNPFLRQLPSPSASVPLARS